MFWTVGQQKAAKLVHFNMQSLLPLARSRGTDEDRAAAHRHLVLETMRRRRTTARLEASSIDGALRGCFRLPQPSTAPSMEQLHSTLYHPAVAHASPQQRAEHVLRRRYESIMLAKRAGTAMPANTGFAAQPVHATQDFFHADGL